MPIPGTDRPTFLAEAGPLLARIVDCATPAAARRRLYVLVTRLQHDVMEASAGHESLRYVRARDCARALRGMLTENAEKLSGFSVAGALLDLAHDRPRPDLTRGFYAEMLALARGLAAWLNEAPPQAAAGEPPLEGREASIARSRELDALWDRVETTMARYADGLAAEAITRRAARRERVLQALGGSAADWLDWRWHIANVIVDPDLLARAVALTPTELASARAARAAALPFGVTPYYAALLDDDPEAERDRSLRAQVLPPPDYVREMTAHRDDRDYNCDFMLERDTSPIDLVTRRYPAVAILKPFNTCPQICVYCQRNWEIHEAMAPDASAPAQTLEEACRWLEAHPSVREILVTGGDPLAMPDEAIEALLARLDRVASLDLIRIGSRVPVTLPLRITDRLARIIGAARRPGRREVCLVTHVQHPYEITPELVAAVNRLRLQGVGIYNQLVFTVFVSRRFEATRLRMLLRRSGIDPYYTFAPKGKAETGAYRVPIARLLQEQKEEARLLPGLRRTDAPVFNLPGLGKNYLRASQDRDLISVLPDGARVYEYHSWEKGITEFNSYVGADVPILDYLERLAALGENLEEYASIWYYY